jgi:hypothetical protein
MYSFSGITGIYGVVCPVVDDPLERTNLAASHPEVLQQLQDKLTEYKRQMIPAKYPDFDPSGQPPHGGALQPGWC